MRAEKRLRVPDGGLESLSVKEDSEQDKRFLEEQDKKRLDPNNQCVNHSKRGLVCSLTSPVIRSSSSCPGA